MKILWIAAGSLLMGAVQAEPARAVQPVFKSLAGPQSTRAELELRAEAAATHAQTPGKRASTRVLLDEQGRLRLDCGLAGDGHDHDLHRLGSGGEHE